jgi:hypothetical protein
MANKPPEIDLDDAISHMRESHLSCRDYGHSWRRHDARYVASERAYEQTLRCAQCRTIRRRLIDSHGGLISTHYDYPDGYVIPGLGRVVGDAKAAVRLASVQAMISRGASKSA